VPPGEEPQPRAFALFQRSRAEALAAIARCDDIGARHQAVGSVRAALREQLLALLADCGAAESALRSRLTDADLVRMEQEYHSECERAVADAEQRFHAAYRDLLSRETELHTLDGMSSSAAEGAARANLVLRRRAMEEELRGFTRYHRERYLRQLRELAAVQEDRRAEGNG
jgi:hypothetical protein